MLPPNINSIYAAMFAPARTNNSAISATEILKHTVNFFTGNMQTELAQWYKHLAHTITLALCHATDHYTIPETLIVDVDESVMTCALPEAGHNPEAPVIIEVTSNNDTVTAEINRNKYYRACTVLLIRQRCALPWSCAMLTDEGRMDLREAFLFGCDLHGVDMEEADLEGATLEETNLQRSNLRGANLNNASLIKANLTAANLKNVCLINANLIAANLTEVCLEDARLQEANLQNANLWKANLENAFLQGANLRAAKLEQAKLQSVDLQGSCLEEACLKKADLHKARLQEASLLGAELSEANLREANLLKADLQYALMDQSDLQDSDLRGARLHLTSLSAARLNRANLESAELSHLFLRGADFTDAILDNRSLEYTLLKLPPEWDINNTNNLLNHIDNSGGSLMTMMDSINARYPEIKLKLAREIIASLPQYADITDTAPAILDVMSQAPWADEPDINAWMDGICEDYLDLYNANIMPKNTPGVIRQAAGLFSRIPRLMYDLNGAFIQLVSQGIATTNEADRNNTIQIYERYLQEKKVSPYATLEVFGEYGARRVEWENDHAANFILLSLQTDGHVMLLSQNTLQGMLRPDLHYPVWDHFYLYNSQQEELSPARQAPQILFGCHFPLFLIPYRNAQLQASIYKLLNLLDLDDLLKLFLAATWQRNSPIKLVTPQDQQRLRNIFSAVLDYSAHTGCYSLKEDHYRQIIGAYDLSGASSTARAGTLVILATVFAIYSSSAVFGTEDDSPEMLRFYAYALMASAYDLDRTIFNNEEDNLFTDWKNRLLGLHNTLSCSAILSSIMIAHLRPRFPDALAEIIPATWR